MLKKCKFYKYDFKYIKNVVLNLISHLKNNKKYDIIVVIYNIL